MVRTANGGVPSMILGTAQTADGRLPPMHGKQRRTHTFGPIAAGRELPLQGQPDQFLCIARATRASSISGLPGLSESAQTVSSSPKYLCLKSLLPLSCAACAAPYNDRKRRGSFLSVASN